MVALRHPHRHIQGRGTGGGGGKGNTNHQFVFGCTVLLFSVKVQQVLKRVKSTPLV